MMQFTRQLLCVLALFYLNLFSQETRAEKAPAGHSINHLYDNLLQREYAGPVLFPNHQVERKAVRSPSLRLRFGRSDPDMLPRMVGIEKRWFGDVNQKPIRSPSLRLRFGRRSDPLMPRRTTLDELLERELNNNANNNNDNEVPEEYDEDYDTYERVVRKPQRLRWGRSVPFEAATDNQMNDSDRRAQLLNSLYTSEKLRQMLLAMRQYEAFAHNNNNNNDVEAADVFDDGTDNEVDIDNEANSQFPREVRKPGPLRLRWGRSTGGRGSSSAVVGEEAVQKKKSLNMEKTQTENAKN